ncbi:MAG: type II toxin-antitoxin system HipA family toxin YjjJ [Leptothrix sp. (in: b-proteobacteria)]
MRPRNQIARDQLLSLLGRLGPVSATLLAEQLGVSVATLHRLLDECRPQIVTCGRARRTRHAVRRALRGEQTDLPLYEIDRDGRAGVIGALSAVLPQGHACAGLAEAGWPVPQESRDGWWDGLPYPLHDMRPQGYIGRQIARAEHRALGVAPDPNTWNDDEVLIVLSRIGADTSGSLILGDVAFERWQQTLLQPPEPLPEVGLPAAYAALAERALAAGVPGSSAAGEFPKFSVLRAGTGSTDTPHVLVKFSGADGSPPVQRWADLLVCEHLALDAAATLPGVSSARSRVLQHGGRTFLEVERFDRHGLWGRSRLASLGTLDATLLGDGSHDWTRLAARLAAGGWLADDAVTVVQRLWWFGRLIANSDMHTGNLSLRPQHGRLTLAPTYDMLPMLYAPLPGGELPVREFEPALPLPPQRACWIEACAAARRFWSRAAQDERLSESFRGICRDNEIRLQQVAERV